MSAWPVTPRRFPSLTVATPRLLVRPLLADDAKYVSEIFADKLVRRWLPVAQDDDSDFDGLDWCTELAIERRGSGVGDHYGIVRREDGWLVGCLWTKNTDWISRSTEIAHVVAAEVRGFGIAPEAVDVLAIALLLEHRFQRVELRVAPGNVPSRRVAEKAGFTYEGLLRNAGNVHSGRVDLEVWSMVTADIR